MTMSLMDIPVELLELIIGDFGLSKTDWAQTRLCCWTLNDVIRPLIFNELSIGVVPAHWQGRKNEFSLDATVHVFQTLADRHISPGSFVSQLSMGLLVFPHGYDTGAVQALVKPAMESLVNLKGLRWTTAPQSATTINQAVLDILLRQQSLEELELSSLHAQISAPSLGNLRKFAVTALKSGDPFDSAKVAVLLAACPNISTLTLDGGRGGRGSLENIRHVFPLSLTNLLFTRFNLTCTLPAGVWKNVTFLQVQCQTSPEFWQGSSPVIIHMDTVDEATVDYLASSPCCLEELVAPFEMRGGVEETLFMVVLPRHGGRLKKLHVGSPYNLPFSNRSSMAKGLQHCPNLEFLGVALSEDYLKNFDEPEVDDNTPPFYRWKGADSLITLMEFAAKHLPRLSNLEVEYAWPEDVVGLDEDGIKDYREGVYEALARSLGHLPMDEDNLGYFQKLNVRIGGIGEKLYTVQRVGEDATWLYLCSEPVAKQVRLPP